MTRISYAQNYEDVMLVRALRGIDHGFYIDIGAQDPVDDSVTKAFYEMGWHGINVEPVRHWFQRLGADRPRDTNLQLAVSDSPGVLHLFEVVDSGLSTTTLAFAQQHVLEGREIRESDVPCMTLDSICEMQQVGEVHFLKIDCEGSEAAALRGASLQDVRPWIILLEATEPNSQEPAYEEWEPLLTERGYHFIYADGLNRFYIADEHAELDAAFSFPPNIFDKFVRAAEATARDRLDIALVERSEWRMRAEHMHSENERREAALVEYRSQQAASVQREMRHAANLAGLRHRLDIALVECSEWRMRAEHMHSENERREAALVEYRTQRARWEQQEVRHAANMAELQERLEESVQRQSLMLAETSSLESEVGRLHHEIVARDRELVRLNEFIRAIHRSTSWRVTWPLRLLKRGTRMVAKNVLRALFQMVRLPMRLARPLLRQIAQWAWLRSLTTGLMGKDSRLIGQARLFLFGVPPGKQEHEAQEREEEEQVDVPLTWQANRVYEEIQQARTRLGREDKPSRAERG